METTDEHGKPINRTKTLSDRYVFNTAITRSQSLVVVVGNPYLLMKGEDNVGDTYNSQQNPKCWSHYLQRCIESRSFELSETIKRTSEIEQQIIKLKDTVYSRCHPDDQSMSTADSTQQDAILKAYKSMINESHLFRSARLILSRGGADAVKWNIQEDAANDPIDESIDVQQTDEDYADEYKCILRMNHFTTGEASPLDSQKEIVNIRGFNNRKGAFDGDTVEVGVFNDNPIGKCYGRVLRVIERANDGVFLCQVTKNNGNSFSPVSRTDPLFFNLPFLTRRILESRDKESIHEHLDSTNDVVVVFDTQSVENSHDLPQIKKTYPLSVALNMLFLVRFIKWDLKYRNPLGVVVEALPKGVSLYNAERLLRLQHNIKPSVMPVMMDCSELFQNPLTTPPDHYCFTVDPENARLLDDAISLKRSKDDPTILELGIHIINVAKYVTKGSRIDELACHRGISVYPGCSGTLAPIDMLPPSFRENLSLMPTKKHNVFSLTLNVKVHDEKVSIMGDPVINETVAESVVQLTYEAAQQVMDTENCTMPNGTELFEEKNSITLKQALKSLYLISCHLRSDRLRNDSCFVYDISDPGEEKCWQAHLMIEELMIFINKHVAETLHSYSPTDTLLRRQGSPNVTKLAKVVEDHQRVMCFSHSFTQLITPDTPTASNFLVPTNLLKELVECCSSKALLVNTLSSVRLFPQLSVVNAQLRTCYSGAEYCCTVADPSQDYKHYGLNLKKYTNFSSPLRRYADIVTQQMLTESLTLHSPSIGYSTEELTKMCQQLNKKVKSASKFENQMSVVAMAANLMSSSEVFDGFVCSIEKGSKIELVFPSLRLKHFMSKDRSFRLQHLGPVKSVNKHGLYSIDMQVASMSARLGAAVLDFPSLVNLQNKKEVDAHSEVVCKLWTASEKETLSKTLYEAGVKPDVVPMSTKKWKECMEFTKDPCDKQVAIIKGHLQNTLLVATRQPTVGKVSPIETCPISFLKLQFKIEPYKMFKVWLTWSSKGAFINPAIQMIELSPFARVCVQHNSNPAECFSDPILMHASRRTYPNVKRYVELWEKIVLAEASQSSVRDSSMVILQHVVLNWPRLQIPANCIDERYYIPTDNVTFEYSDLFLEHCSELFTINIGDLVCARYGIEESSSVRGVFHFVVCGITEPKRIKDVQTISLKVVGKGNCRVSEQVKSILKSPCELQVITLSTSFQ